MAIQELSREEVAVVAGGGGGVGGIVNSVLPPVLGLVNTVLKLPLVENLLDAVGNTLNRLTRG